MRSLQTSYALNRLLPRPIPLNACAACNAVIEPCTAAFIRVRAPSELCKKQNVSAEPLASLLEKHGCAAVPLSTRLLYQSSTCQLRIL